MHRILLAALVGLLAPAAALAATPAADGTLLSSQPCPPQSVADYDSHLRSMREELDRETANAAKEGFTMPPISDARLAATLPDRAAVADHLAYRGFECHRITYASDGMVVAGLLWKPAQTAGKRLPLLIAVRGGNNTFGPMEPWRYWGWHEFLKAGYVVLATQFRGGPGSEGRDGFGSAGDLADVRALVPLARSLGYVDTDRIFAHGGSRGGMQTYMLAREGFPFKAIAIRAGLADIRRSFARRPRGLGDATEMMSDYPDGADAALDRRSAALWADEITVPTIIFHGTDDWRLPVEDALDVAAGLRKAGTPFELHLYDGDTHTLTLNESDMIARTLAFFARHGGPAAPAD